LCGDIKQLQKHESILQLTEDITALQIGADELIALKAAMNQAVKLYNVPPLAATLRLIEDIKLYNKIGGLESELQKLWLHKFALTALIARQAEGFIAVAKMQNQGQYERIK
jgi:hypothetical protein